MIMVTGKETFALQITPTDIEPGGDNHSIPQKFKIDFKDIWKRFHAGKMTVDDKTSQLNVLLGSLSPEARVTLETMDSENKTPLSRLVGQAKHELQEEKEKLAREEREKRSKMGQGKRPPKGERIRTRMVKAAERKKY